MGKILITGSNGLLGQNLVWQCQKKGQEFLATSSGKNRNPELNPSSFHPLDITDHRAVEEIIGRYRPEAIINTAAMTQVDQCETEKDKCRSLNVHGVENLLKAAESYGSKLIHLSTDFIFDGMMGMYKESDIPNPLSFYGQSKLDAENLILSKGGDHSIVRTVLVYGFVPNMSRSNIVLWVKNSLENGKEIQVVNDQWRTPTLAEDLAQGCLLIFKKKAGGIFHISGEELLTPYDIAIRVAEHFGLDKDLIKETDGSKFTQAAKRPPKTGFDISKAKNMLGYKPLSLEEGLEKTNNSMLKYAE